MKIRPGYVLRKVMDIHVIVGIGEDAFSPNVIMSLNDTGAFLWGLLETDTTKEALVKALCAEYAVDADTAAKDVEAFLAQLRDRALISE
ncbi:MAG: PqqD family protein [Clostridiales bacterium]|nr:PqqD family protein [Clostridiales bacterium]